MNEIEHDGVVENITGNKLMVRIVTKSACASCKVNNLCNPSEMKEKLFEIEVPDSEKYLVGDKVNLSISEKQGIVAVFLGYIVPLILLVGGLFIGLALKLNELASAGIAFGLTGLYYLCLFLVRQRTMKYFVFNVTRL